MHTAETADQTVATAFSVAFAPSEQFMRDVLATACEGGSNYWARFKALETFKGEYGDEWQRVRVTDIEEAKTGVHEVGFAELLEGMRRIVAGDMTSKESHANVHASHRAALFEALISEDGGDAGKVDANLADLVLQAAALGRIVYG